MMAETVTLTADDKLGGIGASDIGKLFTKAGIKAKTAQTLAYEKAVELIEGEKKQFTTSAMQHGLYSEPDAFHNVIQPVYPNAVYQSDVSILIKDCGANSLVWATPDVVDDVEGITFDIKCPASIFGYMDNIRATPASYVAQNQMQMIATEHKNGMLLFYLTANKYDEFGNKVDSEYKIDINHRHTFIPIESNKEFQQEVLTRVEEFFKLRDIIYNDLCKAIPLTDEEFFNLMLDECRKVTRFKDKSNLTTWGGNIYKVETEGYMVIE